MAELSRIEVNDTRVRRRFADGRVESVSWAHLALVAILTTEDGPFSEDQFWVLQDTQGGECVVPMGLAPESEFLDRFQALSGFDNSALIDAARSTAPAMFTCWHRTD